MQRLKFRGKKTSRLD